MRKKARGIDDGQLTPSFPAKHALSSPTDSPAPALRRPLPMDLTPSMKPSAMDVKGLKNPEEEEEEEEAPVGGAVGAGPGALVLVLEVDAGVAAVAGLSVEWARACGGCQ